MDEKILYGRLVTWPKAWGIPEGATALPSFLNGRCFRCGQDDRSPLPNGQYYCLACLNLGRVSSLDALLTLPEPNAFEAYPGMQWKGRLTEAQRRVGEDLVRGFDQGKQQLVWAVTGAGKTEMLFLVINHALLAGKRVAVLSPRVDVVLELAPRLKAVFPVFTQVLYGGQEERYQYSQFVIGTTHQALRFYRAFDLIVIDEVDAFPYQGDVVLGRAVQQAKKEDGCLIYLTATPAKKLLAAGRRGELTIHELPARFHGQPLPVPRFLFSHTPWQQEAPNGLKKAIRTWEARGQPFLIFVPHVTNLKGVGTYLASLTTYAGSTVHASDPDRASKVRLLRSGEYRYLVTTTILERGVTVLDLQVAVLGADDPVFKAQALVQIAGRVGRGKDSAKGDVLFIARSPTYAMHQAKKVIQERNEQARRRLE